ncbi:MAG: DUF4124 domain-containing protein [Marinobacter sp.]|nr:DUF4124 domain-containing protein [Marinobacter sp.]
MRRVWLCLALTLPLGAQAHIYRCEGPEGVSFTDQPCTPDSEPLELPDNRIGGDFRVNLPPADPPATPPDPSPAPDAALSPCRFINSTELRTYLVRNQVVPGMTQDHVRRAFGNPRETQSAPQEAWIYHTRYYGYLQELTFVYFRDGCVERVEYREP